MSILGTLFWGILLTMPALADSTNLAIADSLFNHRNDRFDSTHLRMPGEPISRIEELYYNVLKENPSPAEQEEAFWKLLRTLYLKGQFAAVDKEAKKAVYGFGIEVGERYIGKFEQSVECNVWLGIIWARWAEVFGILPAARKGAAGKIRHYAEKSIRLDDRYLGAGGYRLLGMLHYSVPNIPLLLTWPSKDSALVYLEKAHLLAPDNLYNKFYLAQVFASFGMDEQADALLLEIIDAKDIVHDKAVDALLKSQAADFRNNL